MHVTIHQNYFDLYCISFGGFGSAKQIGHNIVGVNVGSVLVMSSIVLSIITCSIIISSICGCNFIIYGNCK